MLSSIGRLFQDPSAASSSVAASSSIFVSYELSIYQGFNRIEQIDVRLAYDQNELIEKLRSQVESTHSFVQVRLPLGQPLPDCYDDAFQVIERPPEPREQVYFLGPQVESESPVKDTDYMLYTYANGVKEVSVSLSNGSRRGIRYFPKTGVKEHGLFRDIPYPGNPRALEQPFSGIRRIPDEKPVYVSPNKWFFPVNMVAHAYVRTQGESAGELIPASSWVELRSNDRPIYLVDVETDDRTVHLMPAYAPANEYQEVNYSECVEFSKEQVLCAMLQSQELYFSQELEEDHKRFDIPQVLTLLLTPSAQLQGSLPLHRVYATHLPMIFAWADQEGVVIDLHAVDPNTKETLFSQQAKQGYGLDLYRLMLERDPTVIKQLYSLDVNKSFLTSCLQKGRREAVELFVEKAQEQGVSFSLEDQWLLRVYQEDPSFSDEEFAVLNDALKWDLFQLANQLGNIVWILRLRDLLPLEKGETIKAPSLFAPSMDYLRRYEVTGALLKDLRATGHLCFASEYATEDKSKWFSKGVDFGRILGASYATAIIDELKLTRIKIPRKIAVIHEGVTEVKFDVERSRDPGVFCIRSEDCSIYAQRILATRTHATLEEMKELLSFVEASGYADVSHSNFILAEDGIYLIDLEFTNFDSVPQCQQWGRMIQLCVPAQQEEFENDMKNKINSLIEQRKHKGKAPKADKRLLEVNGFLRMGKPMHFQVDSFMNASEASAASSSSSSSVVKQKSLKDVFDLVQKGENLKGLIDALPSPQTRRLVYKITAEWGNQGSDVRWGKRHCAKDRAVLMGVLTAARLIQLAEASKKRTITSSQIEGVCAMIKGVVQALPEQFLNRLYSQIKALPPVLKSQFTALHLPSGWN